MPDARSVEELWGRMHYILHVLHRCHIIISGRLHFTGTMQVHQSSLLTYFKLTCLTHVFAAGLFNKHS